MGFVKKMDQNVAKHRIGVRMKKWWWYPFVCMVDVVLQVEWVLFVTIVTDVLTKI